MKYERKYLGVTITSQNYREILQKEGREGINFHNKHLKAYLKGWDSFQFGYETFVNPETNKLQFSRDLKGNLIPKYFNTLVELNPIKE
jgi:hypothetical protein